MPVVRLPDESAHDPEQVGAKAATLASLAARYRVPSAFTISEDLVDGELRTLVAHAYAELGEGEAIAVAVRSSAIGEDGAEASFAGQHETVLNVRGVDAVLEAVAEVQRSATSERALAYRREKGIQGIPRIAVLVQRMVEADAAAIAFTADPVTGDLERVIVNACRGLGDAMASGELTPDTVAVRKADLAVERRNVSDDAALAADDPVLTDDQAREVARLALDLEREMGHPVDIEAAFERGTLWLLQCRPITALADDFPITWPEPGDEQLTWRREDAHYAGARPPLSVEYTRFGAATGIERRNDNLGPPIRFRFEEFNGFIYAGSRTLAPADEMPGHQQAAREKRRALGRRLVRDWEGRYLPAVHAQYAWLRSLRPAAMSPEEAASAWQELWRRVSDVWEIHMLVTGGSYVVMDDLAELYEQLTGRPAAEAFTLTHGLARTLQQLQRDTFALAETARSLPRVAQAIRTGVDALDVLRDLPGGGRFAAAFDAFLERHGDLGQPSEELRAPAWADEPSLLMRDVRRALEAPPEDPDIRLARLLADGETTERRARDLLRDRPEDLARFDELVGVARAVGPLTEEHNYWIDRFVQAHARRAVLAFGARMVADGSVERADDVFFFYVPEAADALRRPRDLRAFVAERRARHARNVRRRAPEVIGVIPQGPLPGLGTAPSPRIDLLLKVEQDDPDVLKGVGASAGVGRGPARLVREPRDLDRVRPGDVLVCRSSNVSYVPVYGKVAAVVTEVGGALSHAAVVAREFGVPCVVATGVALTVLRDGELVEVDGTAGTVKRVPARVEGAGLGI